MVALMVAIGFVTVGMAFWKKSGLIMLFGGVIIMLIGIGIDGTYTYRQVMSSTMTGNITETEGEITETFDYEQVESGWPYLLRIMIAFVGVMFVVVGVLRYGFSI